MNPRRFSPAQRTALYLAADGRCTSCHVELEPGWHADHIHPHAAGGATDVINGQALCPPCNLKKGSTVTDLRAWQQGALDRFLATRDDFLAVATPGAGKTTLALAAAERLMGDGEVSRLIVVVPTAHLRGQWATAGVARGIHLDHMFTNAGAALARDFDGLVVTYQAVAAEPQLYRRLTAEQRTLVVLDEIHHCGEASTLSWGRAVATAFEHADRRLLLSGTPFRSDGSRIPWVSYSDDGQCQPSWNYDYGSALLDRTVVRPIEFLALDGTVRWRESGVVREAGLVDANSEDLSNALGTAYDPDGQWVASVLRRADEELTRHREQVPDAGGLVIAADQYRARRYADHLTQITGAPAALAISDEPNASTVIRQFATGTARWIVAVQMVAEGVDIPRLAVGVYASRIRTEMFFRQVVGRFVRMRGPEDETTATMLVPSIQPLLSFAQDIEKTVQAVLREEEEQARRELKDGEQGVLYLDLVEPLGSSEATHHSTITSGTSLTDAELARAQAFLDSIPGLPASLTPAHMARIMRATTGTQVVGTATVRTAAPIPLAQAKRELGLAINRKVGRLSRETNEPHGHIHARLNRICGDTRQTATAQSLERRLTLLDEALRDLP